MAKAIDISVIVAAYNVEGYIERAVQSALSQEGVSLEVIVVDDCSSDETVNIVRSIKDKRLVLVQHDVNQGPGAARNTAIEKAKGEWIAVLDGDDAFEEGRLARLKALAESGGAEIVCDNLLLRPESDEERRTMFDFEGATKISLADFIENNSQRFESYSYGYLKPFVSKKFVQDENLKYPTDISIGEDYIFMASILASGGKCLIEPTAGYLYTIRQGSISHRLTSRGTENMLKSHAAFNRKYVLNGAAKKAQQHRKSHLLEMHAYNLLVEAIKSKSIGGVFAALKVCPWAAWRLWEPLWVRVKRLGKSEEPQGPLVLLFFDGYDLKARDGRAGRTYSRFHYYARLFKRMALGQQSKTGFYTAFQSMQKSLQALGADVRVNDFEAARANPDHPIGVAGYRSDLGLPNPVILGPGDFGTPDKVKPFLEQDRFKALIQPSDWFARLYEPFGHGKVQTCFFGIDADKWCDRSAEPKEYDFLIYDKLYWNREQDEKKILQRVLDTLNHKDHSYLILKYGDHPQNDFIEGLKKSRAMIYLSAHETQGFSVQEALSSNVPVLAWDEGAFMDPALSSFMHPDVNVSSVPYFDETCGLSFKIDHFEAVFADFWSRLDSFKPRDFVLENLSYEKAARRYLEIYNGAADARQGLEKAA